MKNYLTYYTVMLREENQQPKALSKPFYKLAQAEEALLKARKIYTSDKCKVYLACDKKEV